MSADISYADKNESSFNFYKGLDEQRPSLKTDSLTQENANDPVYIPPKPINNSALLSPKVLLSDERGYSFNQYEKAALKKSQTELYLESPITTTFHTSETPTTLKTPTRITATNLRSQSTLEYSVYDSEECYKTLSSQQLLHLKPGTPQQQQQQQQLQNEQNEFNSSKKVSLYKTELCRSFEETGTCRYGNKCQFAHHVSELRTISRHPRYKTEICRTFWDLGTCPYGKRCCFIHTENDNISSAKSNTAVNSDSKVNVQSLKEKDKEQNADLASFPTLPISVMKRASAKSTNPNDFMNHDTGNMHQYNYYSSPSKQNPPAYVATTTPDFQSWNSRLYAPSSNPSSPMARLPARSKSNIEFNFDHAIEISKLSLSSQKSSLVINQSQFMENSKKLTLAERIKKNLWTETKNSISISDDEDEVNISLQDALADLLANRNLPSELMENLL